MDEGGEDGEVNGEGKAEVAEIYSNLDKNDMLFVKDTKINDNKKWRTIEKSNYS